MQFLRLSSAVFIILCMTFHGMSAWADIETAAEYAYMVDADTGTVLIDKRSQESMNPSSMSKLMTLYVLFEEIKAGNLDLTSTFKVSEKAWKMGGSKMFVKVGSDVSVEDLIRGIIVQSGNDACVVVAEGISGTEEAFAIRLNETAKKLGLSDSHFTNSTGWPDPEHVMSARDIALLSKSLIRDFPEYYHYFAEKEFTYSGITQYNRNSLLGNTLGVDGLKTGHTEVAGYGISLSAKDADNGRRVVLVLNGLQSDSARVSEGAKLLSYGLKAFENVKVVHKGHTIEHLPVWFGDSNTVAVAADADHIMTVSKGSKPNYKVELHAVTPLSAPIKVGDQVATLRLINGEQVEEFPLVAAEAVHKATGPAWLKQFFYRYLLGSRD